MYYFFKIFKALVLAYNYFSFPSLVQSFHSFFSLTISHSVGLASLKVLSLSNPPASIPSSWDSKHTLLSSHMFISFAILFAGLQNQRWLGKTGTECSQWGTEETQCLWLTVPQRIFKTQSPGGTLGSAKTAPYWRLLTSLSSPILPPLLCSHCVSENQEIPRSLAVTS